MNVRKLVVISAATGMLVTTGCSSDPRAEATPVETATVAAEPTDPTTPAPSAIDPGDWCADWWEQVVEQSDTDPDKATGAAFLLAEEGTRVNDELISDRAAVIDYNTGPSATESEIQQAYDDLELACAVYNVTD